jgi:hypothetical protein|nr:MAG: hypothetical protein DIU62_02995 [Pseudomonadota bacterium]
MRKLPPPPLAHSYWVEPARLLAGEHPCAVQGIAQSRRVQLLVAAGIRAFIDLTEEGEQPDYRHFLPSGVNYHRLSIPDHSVPRTPDRMREILKTLARELRRDAAVYVHCRAGYGRTGTTIGCWLREQGLAPRQAVDELNRLWQQNARSSVWPVVPETEEQERYILQWKVEAARAPAG